LTQKNNQGVLLKVAVEPGLAPSPRAVRKNACWINEGWINAGWIKDEAWRLQTEGVGPRRGKPRLYITF
jgi:hypothetical protein